MDILDHMWVSKLSAKVFFFKVNYFFNPNSNLDIADVVLLQYVVQK